MRSHFLLAVGSSPVSGQGVFAGAVLPKGTIALRIQGRVLSIPQFFRVTQKVRDNTYRLSNDTYLDPSETLGKYINHSCAPNCAIQKRRGRLLLVTSRRISRGEELFFDYATVLAKDDYWVMRCHCSAKHCRGVIKNFTFLPPAVHRRYRKQHILPLYIQNIPAEQNDD
jgi:SET domain-containing protein